jgi:RHS repeat-associated protein
VLYFSALAYCEYSGTGGIPLADTPDHLNTPRLIADSAGTTVWRWDQGEPFGNDVPNDNPSGAGAFDFPLRFPGQYADRETNLAYNWMRDYDSAIGRYVESDPMGLMAGLNTYNYVRGNPLFNVDPTGLAGARGGGSRGGYDDGTGDLLTDSWGRMCGNHAEEKIAEYVRQIQRAKDRLGPCQKKCYIVCSFAIQSELGECSITSFLDIFDFNEGCEYSFLTATRPGHWTCRRGVITGRANACCK